MSITIRLNSFLFQPIKNEIKDKISYKCCHAPFWHKCVNWLTAKPTQIRLLFPCCGLNLISEMESTNNIASCSQSDSFEVIWKTSTMGTENGQIPMVTVHLGSSYAVLYSLPAKNSFGIVCDQITQGIYIWAFSLNKYFGSQRSRYNWALACAHTKGRLFRNHRVQRAVPV